MSVEKESTEVGRAMLAIFGIMFFPLMFSVAQDALVYLGMVMPWEGYAYPTIAGFALAVMFSSDQKGCVPVAVGFAAFTVSCGLLLWAGGELTRANMIPICFLTLALMFVTARAVKNDPELEEG